MKVFINESILAPGGLWEPSDRMEFEDNIKSIIDSIKCFGFLNEIDLYFNSVGIKQLIDELKIVNACEEYLLFDKIAQLREAIKNCDAMDWSENKLQKNDINYLVQLGEGFTPVPSNGTSIAEACESKYLGEKILILNFLASVFNTEDVIKVIRGNVNPPKDMDLVKIDCLCKKEYGIKYYLKSRKIRYNHNNKHGENHNDVKYENGEVISPLKCKIHEATELLKLAVGNKKSDKLFAFDFERKEFIEFKYDNTLNPMGYHGYHPHDQKIPPDIKRFIKDNIKIFKNELPQ